LQGIRRDIADFERNIQNEETAKALSTQEKKERPVLNKLNECLAGEDLSAQAQPAASHGKFGAVSFLSTPGKVWKSTQIQVK
jgi:hypothetical protein